jgi:hypothetical protein
MLLPARPRYHPFPKAAWSRQRLRHLAKLAEIPDNEMD